MKTDVIVTGSIVLTEKLAQKYQSGELKSLDKADVNAYLKANFHWRIQALDFSEIPRNSPPAGLNVTVFNVPVTIPQSDTEVPNWTGDLEYNDDIDGNPPVYNGPGMAGTNSTLPVGEIAGTYNATSGEFEWKNGTRLDAAPKGENSTSTVLPTRYVTITAPQTLSPTPSPVFTSGSLSSAQAPEPTPPAGPRTRYVTTVIMEYVTL
jgi:tyrosinase